LSRSYAPTELKRRLKPALEELEQLGFLEPLGPEERYSYVKRGCWRIIFLRGRSATAEAQDPAARQDQPPSELVEALKARGVTAKTAQELVEMHPPGRIRTKLEVFDWLLRNEDRRIGKNPAGYLVASIRSDYQAPGDYQTQGVAKPAAEKARRLAAEAQQAQRQAQEQRDQAREAKLRAAWEKLPESEREAIRAAVKAENPSLGRWKNVLEPLYLAALEARLNNPGTPTGAGTGQRLLFSSES
jgi:hypothetical protein